MSIIPAAVLIRLRADADDQPKGPSVVTPLVGVVLGRGTLDCHHRMNPSKRLVRFGHRRGGSLRVQGGGQRIGQYYCHITLVC